MALIYMDSFDHYTTTAIAQLKGWGSGITAIESARFSNGLRFRTTAVSLRNLPSSYVTIVAGFAFKHSPQTTADGTLLRLQDTGTVHIDLRLSATGTLKVTRNGTQLGSNGTEILLPGVWYYIEIKTTIDDSAGVAIVRVNGVTDINLSSQDTRNGANASVNQLVLGCANATSGTDFWFDDLYVLDTSGGAPTNDLLGDCRVQALFPDGNGNSSQFVGSDADSTDNYLLVDEASPNDETDYVESSTVGDKDTYTYGNLGPTSGTVYGVQIDPYARKTDAGTRSIVSVARLSATETDGPVQTLSTSYQYLPDIREAKPGGGVWSISDVNSAEFGVKVNA